MQPDNKDVQVQVKSDSVSSAKKTYALVQEVAGAPGTFKQGSFELIRLLVADILFKNNIDHCQQPYENGIIQQGGVYNIQ
jgi:hypothetical protein